VRAVKVYLAIQPPVDIFDARAIPFNFFKPETAQQGAKFFPSKIFWPAEQPLEEFLSL
jgi:hypothetical protein